MKESSRVLIALVAAIVVGLAIAASGNDGLLKAADYLAPAGVLWVNAIRMTVIPLVVSLLITAVASTSDVRTIGRLGGRTIVVFLALLAGCALVVIPFGPALGGLFPVGAAGARPMPPGAADAAGQIVASAQAQTFSAWITSLIPVNPIAAAASGAMVPFTIFTILLALAIARSPAPARATLVGFFQALADAMLVLIRGVISLAPIGVFALIVPIAARAGAELAGGIGVYILTYSAGGILLSLLLYPVVALAGRVPIRKFARAALPPQLIAFSSASSIASLPALVEAAETGLGLSPRVSGFVLPLAVSTFKFAGPLSWTVGTLFVGWFFHVQLGAREFGIIAFSSVFLSFAAPGIPGGAFIMLTPLFQAIGLPPEGIAILLAVDAIPDRFSTVLNVTGDLAAAAIVARAPELPEAT